MQIRHKKKKVFTVGELLLLSLEGRGKVEGVEDPARVPALVRGQAVLLEDGVLVDASRVLDVLPPPDLDVVEQNELDDEESGRRGEVLFLPGIVPLGDVEDADLGENLRQEHAGHSQHGPTPIHELGLDEPSQVLWVLGQSQRIESVVTGKTECTHSTQTNMS